MSAVAALQFDSVFGMGSRSSYATWPAVAESNNGLLSNGLSSYGSDASLSPPVGSRSATASPPRQPLNLTPQQRELKRQRELARREAKVASRRHDSSSLPTGLGISGISAAPASGARSSVSGPASVSSTADSTDHSTAAAVSIRTPSFTDGSSPASFMQSPPVSMADLSTVSSGAAPLPVVYATTSGPQISLLAEPVTSGATPPYSASYSPPMQDHAGQGVFSSTYPPQTTYIADYSTAGFPATTSSPLPQYGYVSECSPERWSSRSNSSSRRSSALPDQQNMLYQMPQHGPQPPLMGPGPLQPPHQAQLPHLGHHAQVGGHHHGLPHSSPRAHESLVGSSTGPSGVRVMQSRPKPQCWEHGCNGRQFSTFSNLLRHQREKSGQAAKAVCPNCGAEFTRTTARNGHLAHDKCKQRRSA